MMKNGCCELRIVQRPDQLGTLTYMLLHDRVLGVGERSLLLKDLGRGVELADIVKEGRHFDQHDLLTVQPHPPSRPRSVSRHTPRMPMEVGIALVQRDRKLFEELGAFLNAPRGSQSIE